MSNTPSVHTTALDLAKTTDSRAERWAFLLLASLEESADRRLQRWNVREAERMRKEQAHWSDWLMQSLRSIDESISRREHERSMREAMSRAQAPNA